MAYLALFRKYRPQTFEEMVGQEAVAVTLQNAVRAGRIAQAYLFAGPRGVGKTTAARILAKCLNCQEGPTPTPCNRCESCQRIAQGSALDIVEIDAASNRGIDDIRNLRESVRYAPAQGRYKFYILDEAHQITADAFNALLKTLEEPPPKYHFLLTAPASDLLLQTILSRCRIVRLGALTTEAVYAYLQAHFDLPQDTLQTLAEFSEGALGRAVRWAQTLQSPPTDAKGKPMRSELEALQGLMRVFERLGQASLDEALRLAHDFREACKALEGGVEDRSARAALALGLEYLIQWYRDSLALPYEEASLRFASHKKELSELARRFGSVERAHDLQAITEARRAILGNANAQIVTEHLFIQLLRM